MTSSSRSASPLRLAAIDLGTNSFHMIIVELLPDMSFTMIDRAKEMIRIGAGSMMTKQLSAAAMAQGLDTLMRFRKLAEQRGVDVQHIVAFATSAIREAKNGEEFMEMIASRVGIRTRIISGEEEGRLIYLAIRRAINIGKRKALMIDVGGGSVEFMIGDAQNLYFVESKKLGVARLLERFVTTDPISDRELSALEGHLVEEIRPVAKAAKAIGFDFAIASSGTAENIAAMILLAERGQEFEALNGSSFSRRGFLKLYEKLLAIPSEARRQISGLDPQRAELIVPGMVLFDVMMRLFDLKEITISEYALREGIVLDYLSRHLAPISLTKEIEGPRLRSVLELARRCQWDESRSRHIAHLSLQLFDQLESLHELGKVERELLQYAAYLHNIGYFISPSAHHKHSQYIIQNAGLKGFSPEEIQIMANVARYHRKSPPKVEHVAFQSLSPRNKHVVRVLASLLRLANALDRGHRQNVKSVKAIIHPKKIELRLTAISDPEIEIWAATQMSDMFEAVFSRKLVLSVEQNAD
ncbi:MAG: phosphatase [[Chlorobium] sp. 445]|nr:MAG: phosphatase [[Chlorobium] sp. 445]